MKGHETLLQLRAAGRTPGIVFINDYPCKTDWFTWGDHATVSVAGDNLEDIDLRFVVGIKASISGATIKRAKALMQMAINSGATAVGAACGEWAEIWHKQEEVKNG